MVDDATVKAFMSLFRGRTDAWGSVEGRSNKEKVTKKHYERHLNGETSLGVYMLQDDATCWFFALDLDFKDISKALVLRKTFNELGVNAYLAFSKSKGFHCYVFADQKPFVAKDIRRFCHAVLAKTNIPCEVFPKQDELDEVTPLGNYINLPCFGNSRMFFGASKAAIHVVDAVKRIQRVSADKITAGMKTLPAPPKPAVIKTRAGRPRKSKNPPCVDELLKGVQAGSRDEAAFALARYFLFNQRNTESEVLQLLQTWDENNHPPLDDPHLLKTKVQSAGKGYNFGCSSITGNPMLSKFCVGEDRCGWLQEITKDKLKKGLIREQSFHESETHLYEEVYQEGKCFFVAYNKETREVNYIPSIDFPDFSIMPIRGQEISENVIQLPSEAVAYGSTITLKNEVKELIRAYVDIDSEHLEYSSWYVLLSWVYDKLNTIAYLRFLGDTGCGKSRALDVIGRLCYKPLMMAGAVTPAPIYREIRRFRGTLILEEADFRDTTEKSEVITILNCGIERGRAVIRCSQDNPDILEVLPCYGPKVFATRQSFVDKALEARCITCVMEETDRDDIPAILGRKFAEGALRLRNKLLLWRLHHRNNIDPDAIEEINLGHIEPRLKQMGLPFALPFKDLPDVMEDFRRFMQERQTEIIHQRSESEDGLVIQAFFQLASLNGKDWITPGMIAQHLSTDNISFSPQKVSGSLRPMNVKTRKARKPGEGRQGHYIIWNTTRMRRLLRRFVPEPEEYKDLFEEDIDMEV